jgi:hypothetical protein
MSRLLTLLVALSIFVCGALAPSLHGTDPFRSGWLGFAALSSVLVLPVLAFGSAVGAVQRLVDRRSGLPLARRLEVCVVAAAATTFLLYFSPWGVAAVRWVVAALD